MTKERIEQVKRSIRLSLDHGTTRKVSLLAWNAMVVENNDTYPVTRAIIRDMIDEGALIGSTAKGYKLMTTGKEVQQYLNSLLKRQMGISKRIQAVYDAAQNKGIL